MTEKVTPSQRDRLLEIMLDTMDPLMRAHEREKWQSEIKTWREERDADPERWACDIGILHAGIAAVAQEAEQKAMERVDREVLQIHLTGCCYDPEYTAAVVMEYLRAALSPAPESTEKAS